MDFYQPDNLEAIYGVGNPEAYTQGRQQVDMSNMFQGQALAQQQAATQKAGLANLYDQQANPERLRKLQLDNEQTGYENMTKGVAGRQAIATEGLQLDAKKRALALSMSEDELKSKTIQAQQDAYSLDPEVAARGKRMLQLSAAAIEARQKHQDDMEKERMHRETQLKIAGGNNGTALEIARMNNATRQAATSARSSGGGSKSIQDQIASGKLTFEKAAVLYQYLASQEQDEDKRAELLGAAQQYEEANQRARASGAIGKANTDSLGIQSNQPVTSLGSKKPPLGTAANPIVLK